MTTLSPKGQDERLRTIEQYTLDDGSVRIANLAAAFGVSEMTIRRDLDELEALGVVRRVRGGAAAIRPELFVDRHRHNTKAKGIIAAKLEALLPHSGMVAFDSSSTVHRCATRIEGARDLTVVTNSIDTFQALMSKPGVIAILTGGSREPQTGSLVGPVAARSAQEFLFDMFICSAAAMDAELGSSEPSLAEAEVKRALGSASARIVLAVDHTKLGGRGQARLFRPHEIDVLVTDLDPTDRRLAPFRATIREIR